MFTTCVYGRGVNSFVFVRVRVCGLTCICESSCSCAYNDNGGGGGNDGTDSTGFLDSSTIFASFSCRTGLVSLFLFFIALLTFFHFSPTS